MTKKLEDEFNLPPMSYTEPDTGEEVTTEFTTTDIMDAIGAADKIDAALPQVTGLDSLDKDMDEYAQKAMSTFDDLVSLGNNVEDRHAAMIFDTASKMMTNAITAKTAKMDKKLKMIELQMRKSKLDLDERKFAASEKGGAVIHHDSEEIVDSRNSMLESLKSIADSLKNDK